MNTHLSNVPLQIMIRIQKNPGIKITSWQNKKLKNYGIDYCITEHILLWHLILALF